jgi:uncharacterized protein YqiB (DUF1249 family)
LLKRRYVPDIARFGAICEANYVQLCKLLKGREKGASVSYGLHNQSVSLGQIQLLIIETSPYTNLVMLEQIQATGKWLNNPRLSVRLYHDARMAEVISAANHPRVEGVNGYPNRKMHLPDEKLQLNQFLAEWLGYCVQHGHVLLEIKPGVT